MAHFIPRPHHVKHPMNPTNIMMQPGGFRAVTGGPSIFGNGYGCGCGNYGYGNYNNYGGYPVGAGCNVGGCQDADDGKISFGEKVGSFFKGIGNTIKGAVKNLFTPKGFLKAALCVGACFIPGVGPFIAAGLACVGIAKGAGTVIKGAVQANNATTDAEAKAAWENIGGGTFTVAASACALKGASGAIKANTAAVSKGALVSKGASTSKLGTHWQAAKATYRNSSMGRFTTAYGQAAKYVYKANGGGLKGAGAVAKGTYQGIKQNVHVNPNGMFAKAGAKVSGAYNNIKNNGFTNTARTAWKSASQKASNTYYNIKNNGFTNTVKGAYGNLRAKMPKVNTSTIRTKATNAWNTTTKYGNIAYRNIKAQPWTAKAGATTLLDPEEANIRYGINGYYV